MARSSVLNVFLRLSFTLFGLLAHNGIADVNKEYLKGDSNELVFKIIHEFTNSHNHNRNYLPPLAINPTQQVDVKQPSVNYLPVKDTLPISNYDINKYSNIHLTSPETKSLENKPQYRAATYLSPHQSFASNHQQSSYGAYNSNEQKSFHQNSGFQKFTIKLPTYLPAGYDYKNPNQGHSHPESQPEYFQAPKYLPPVYDIKNRQQQQNAPAAKHNTYQPNVEYIASSIQLSSQLPDGYDFVKPAGAEEAIAELHTIPNNDDHELKGQKEQNSALLPPKMGKIRTVQIVNSVAVKTLRVLETEQNGVKHIKILGPSKDIPTGEHYVIKVEAPGSYAQTVKIFNNHQENVDNSNNYYGNFPINSYLPPQESRESHKTSL